MADRQGEAWREWPKVRGQYAMQALLSDVLALGVGLFIGWLLWG